MTSHGPSPFYTPLQPTHRCEPRPRQERYNGDDHACTHSCSNTDGVHHHDGVDGLEINAKMPPSASGAPESRARLPSAMSTVLWLWSWLSPVFGLLFALSLVTYLVTFVGCQCCRRRQNLRRKYDAKWAVVTGASSGIGLAIVEALAAQGLNVVLVAMPDALLEKATKRLSEEYKSQEFRSVGVNLGGDSYLQPIIDATKDIKPQVIVNNAGYILTGFYTSRKMGTLLHYTWGVDRTLRGRAVERGAVVLLSFVVV